MAKNIIFMNNQENILKTQPQQQPPGVLRNFAKFTGKHLYQSLFFNKVMFSFEYCGISKDTFFTEHLWATTSATRIFNIVATLQQSYFQILHIC